jgi:hypothetical protein
LFGSFHLILIDSHTSRHSLHPLLLVYTANMFFSSALQASLFVPAALAIAIPAELDIRTGKINARLDQPDNPWINDSCFNPLTVPEHEVCEPNSLLL